MCLCINFLHAILHGMSGLESIAIMMGGQEGASVANEAINSTFQSLSSTISTNQNSLQDSITEFTNNMKTLQQNEMTEVQKVFTHASSHMASQQTDQTNYFKKMEQYVFQTISLQQPPEHYLLSKAAHIDELFALGTMFTPQGPLWKNVFGLGNWEFDHITNSFWQMQTVPLQAAQSSSMLEKQYLQAANSIFTEYFIRKSSYEIQCEITIHQIVYPFFVGIMFNKTRWISGNMDSITKCRLYGVYGSSNEKIGTYFAEQYTTKVKNKEKQVEPITLYPLEQIIQQQVTPQETLSSKAFETIQHQPISLIVRIITSPTKLQFKIWPKQEKEPTEFTTIQSSHKGLYLYHSLGFISAGAIAQFKLLKPTDLLFSDEAQKDFTQEVEALLAPPPKTKEKTKS